MRRDIRVHLEQQVRRERIDVDTFERKVGSPHKIVFTKNDRRFRRAVRRRRDHLDAWAALGGTD